MTTEPMPDGCTCRPYWERIPGEPHIPDRLEYEQDPACPVHHDQVVQHGDAVWAGGWGERVPTAAEFAAAKHVGYINSVDAYWVRVDATPRPMAKTPQHVALDRVREGAIAWWNGMQR